MTSYLFYGVAVIIGRSASIYHVHCLVCQQLVDNTSHAFTSMIEDKISKFGRRGGGGSKVLSGKIFGWIFGGGGFCEDHSNTSSRHKVHKEKGGPIFLGLTEKKNLRKKS